MEARTLYDNSHIYFAFTCFDSDLSKLVTNKILDNDRIGISFRPMGFVLVPRDGSNRDLQHFGVGVISEVGWRAQWQS